MFRVFNNCETIKNRVELAHRLHKPRICEHGKNPNNCYHCTVEEESNEGGGDMRAWQVTHIYLDFKKKFGQESFGKIFNFEKDAVF